MEQTDDLWPELQEPGRLDEIRRDLEDYEQADSYIGCDAPRAIQEMRELITATSMKIQWDEREKQFTVEVHASSHEPLLINGHFRQRIPVEIAERSHCQCGASLSLGDFSVAEDGADFSFSATYFCESCRSELTARRRGVRGLFYRLLGSISKISVKADGIEIERSEKE